MEEEREKAEAQVGEGSSNLNINKYVYKEIIGGYYSGHYKQQ